MRSLKQLAKQAIQSHMNHKWKDY